VRGRPSPTGRARDVPRRRPVPAPGRFGTAVPAAALALLGFPSWRYRPLAILRPASGETEPFRLYFDLANILVFLLVGLGFIAVNLLLAMILRPKGVKTPSKLAIYECGEPTIGQAWIRFDIRFYTVALMFVVFDIEIALLFPWAAVFKDLVREGTGWIAFLEVMTFIVVLMAGLAYVWARGDLDWTGPLSAIPTTETVEGPETPAQADADGSPADLTSGAARGEPLGARR